jgi:hypothetical protein
MQGERHYVQRVQYNLLKDDVKDKDRKQPARNEKLNSENDRLLAKYKKLAICFAISTVILLGLAAGGWQLFENFGGNLVNYAIHNSLNWFAQYGNFAFVLFDTLVLITGTTLVLTMCIKYKKCNENRQHTTITASDDKEKYSESKTTSEEYFEGETIPSDWKEEDEVMSERT